jgi:hypothetical protein
MSAAEETVRVDIVTKDLGLLDPDVTGLAGPIQAARVIVTAGQDSRSHVVVWSADSAIHLPVDEVIAKLFPSDVVSCVRSAIDGDTTLSCLSADEGTLFSAASAAATVRRSWGWDESPTVVVRFAAEMSFVVDPVFDGRAWSVARTRSAV